jgi:hypothetical protein
MLCTQEAEDGICVELNPSWVEHGRSCSGLWLDGVREARHDRLIVREA